MNYDFDLVLIDKNPLNLAFAQGIISNNLKIALVDTKKYATNCNLCNVSPNEKFSEVHEFVHKPYIFPSELFEKIQSFTGDIKILNKNTVEIFTEVGKSFKLTSKSFLINLNKTFSVPDIYGLNKIEYLTPQNIFSLPSVPKSMIIYGNSSNSDEYIKVFKRLGTEVKFVEAKNNQIESVRYLFPKNIKISGNKSEIWKEINKEVYKEIIVKLTSGEEIHTEKLLLTNIHDEDFKFYKKEFNVKALESFKNNCNIILKKSGIYYTNFNSDNYNFVRLEEINKFSAFLRLFFKRNSK